MSHWTVVIHSQNTDRRLVNTEMFSVLVLVGGQIENKNTFGRKYELQVMFYSFLFGRNFHLQPRRILHRNFRTNRRHLCPRRGSQTPNSRTLRWNSPRPVRSSVCCVQKRVNLALPAAVPLTVRTTSALLLGCCSCPTFGLFESAEVEGIISKWMNCPNLSTQQQPFWFLPPRCRNLCGNEQKIHDARKHVCELTCVESARFMSAFCEVFSSLGYVTFAGSKPITVEQPAVSIPVQIPQAPDVQVGSFTCNVLSDHSLIGSDSSTLKYYQV